MVFDDEGQHPTSSPRPPPGRKAIAGARMHLGTMFRKSQAAHAQEKDEIKKFHEVESKARFHEAERVESKTRRRSIHHSRHSRGSIHPVSHTRGSVSENLASTADEIWPEGTSFRGRKSVRKSVAAFRNAVASARNEKMMSHQKGQQQGFMPDGVMLEEELSKVQIFKSVDTEVLNSLAQHVEVHGYHGDQEIVAEGTMGESLILVLRGIVDLLVDDLKVDQVKAGEYFGETLLLGIEDTWRASLKAETCCTICEVKRNHLMQALEHSEEDRLDFDQIQIDNKRVALFRAGTFDHPCELFSGLDAGTIRTIDSFMVRRLYFPAQAILKEGEPGDSLCILVRGSARVMLTGRVVRLERCCDQEDFQTITDRGSFKVLSKKSLKRGGFRRPSSETPPHDNGISLGENTSPEPVRPKTSMGFSEDSDEDEQRRMSSESMKQKRKTAFKTTDQDSGEDEEKVCDHEEVAASKIQMKSRGSYHYREQDKPVFFGELGMLGLQEVRSASVVADTLCHIRVLHHPVFFRILESFNESLQCMAQFLQNRYDRDFCKVDLNQVAIFQEMKFSRKFLDYLSEHLEGRIFLSGQKVIDENLPDDRCMYILAAGSVVVKQGDALLSRVGIGGVIGEVAALGFASSRSSSCIAEETCCTQVLHQSVIVHGLELFPEERRKVMMFAFARNCDPAISHDHIKDGLLGTSVFADVLKASPLFLSIDPAFVDELSAVAIERIYLPGDFIIEAGHRGDSMFIMISGTAGVWAVDPDRLHLHHQLHHAHHSHHQHHPHPHHHHHLHYDDYPPFDRRSWQRVGTLKEGSISGELAMLGVMQERGATIEAETICSMWEVTQEKALSIIERFPAAQQHFAGVVNDHLVRTVPSRILSSALFSAYDRKFRTLLSLYCDRRTYFPGNRIAREGKLGDSLFIVNLGCAALEKRGVQIKSYLPGMHFGSTVMLGIDRTYFGSLLARQTCHILVVSKTTYSLALEQYPAPQASLDLRHTEKIKTDELKEASQRIAMKKVLWKRYQWMIQPFAPSLTEGELMERVLQGWHQHVQEHRDWRYKRTCERLRYEQMMSEWWDRHLKDQEFVKHRQHMEQVLMHNLGRWGAPIVPKPKVSSADVRYWMGGSTDSRVARSGLDDLSQSLSCRGTSTLGSTQLSTSYGKATASTSYSMRSAKSASPRGYRSTDSNKSGTSSGRSSSMVNNVLWSARAGSPIMLNVP